MLRPTRTLARVVGAAYLVAFGMGLTACEHYVWDHDDHHGENHEDHHNHDRNHHDNDRHDHNNSDHGDKSKMGGPSSNNTK